MAGVDNPLVIAEETKNFSSTQRQKYDDGIAPKSCLTTTLLVIHTNTCTAPIHINSIYSQNLSQISTSGTATTYLCSRKNLQVLLFFFLFCPFSLTISFISCNNLRATPKWLLFYVLFFWGQKMVKLLTPFFFFFHYF